MNKFYIRFEPSGLVIDGSPVHSVGPFDNTEQAHRWYNSPANPLPEGAAQIEVMAAPDAA